MQAGAIVGQYRVVRQIGEGGMGAVYLAEHTLLGRRAAIKVLLPSLSAQREVVERFFNEARATTTIADPGIVQVFDFGHHVDGSAYLVMEYLEGEPLDVRIHRLGRLAVFDALRLTRQAATALGAAHGRGIVHRDLKPENIYLVADAEAQGGERPKVLDFGIAKLNGDEPGRSRTRTGAIMGTPAYMSPEQCRGTGTIDHRADIYALGCVLFTMLTGRTLFECEGAGETIAAHLMSPPRAPSALVPVPPAVDALVARCLAKAPEHRFPSMGELVTAVEAVLARLSVPDAAHYAASMPTVMAAMPPGLRSDYPATTAQLAAPTTLSSGAGVRTTAVGPPSRRGLWLGLAAVVVAAAVAAVLVLPRDAGTAAAGAPEPSTGPALDAAAGPVVAPREDLATVDAGVAPDAAVAATVVDAAAAAPVAEPVDAGAAPDAAPTPERRRPRPRRERRTPDRRPPEDLYDTR